MGDIQDKILELERYSDIEGSEVGELCHFLCALVHYMPYMSDEFITALESEVSINLQNFQENSRIIETEETITRIVSELEWR